MIDRGDIRQAIDHRARVWASPPGAGYGQFEHKADSLIAKFKEAGGNGRERLMYEQSHRDYSAGYLHHRLLVRLLIITVITPLPTKPGATKMPENQLANAAITDMQMRQRDVAALDEIHEGVS